MPRGSEELTNKRKEEIVLACSELYEARGFHDITIKDIGEKTSMSRPSIYNYFETKEEIFLALLTQEYRKWTADLKKLAGQDEQLTADELVGAIARTLSPRECLLKISAMNLFEIEESSRPDNLADYKAAFKDSVEAFEAVLRQHKPDLSSRRIEEIRYAFFPFMYGIYPYAYPTDKQLEAMDRVQLRYRKSTIYEITYNFLKQVIR